MSFDRWPLRAVTVAQSRADQSTQAFVVGAVNLQSQRIRTAKLSRALAGFSFSIRVAAPCSPCAIASYSNGTPARRRAATIGAERSRSPASAVVITRVGDLTRAAAFATK